MRTAVLSDVHGHLPALEAVLAEVDRAGVDRIVITGDVALGPMPVQTLQRLLGLGERVLWVRGNSDRELVSPPLDEEGAVWGGAQLTPALRDHLDGAPPTLTLDVDGLGPTLFCHATPRDDEEVAVVDSPLGRWAEVLAGRDEQTVVLGHTHMPFARLAGGKMIVNPGSVGMPYGRSGAHWAILGPGVELRRTPYDVEAACAVLATSGYPNVERWLDTYVRAPTITDDYAVTVYAQRDGRPNPPTP
jgi:predicted phosphodiesterase